MMNDSKVGGSCCDVEGSNGRSEVAWVQKCWRSGAVDVCHDARVWLWIGGRWMVVWSKLMPCVAYRMEQASGMVKDGIAKAVGSRCPQPLSVMGK